MRLSSTRSGGAPHVPHMPDTPHVLDELQHLGTGLDPCGGVYASRVDSGRAGRPRSVGTGAVSARTGGAPRCDAPRFRGSARPGQTLAGSGG